MVGEHSVPDRRDRVRGSPGETVAGMLMAPGACKISSWILDKAEWNAWLKNT